VIQDNKVVAEERLLTEMNQRVRSIAQGPDGALYILTDDGRLSRVSRKK